MQIPLLLPQNDDATISFSGDVSFNLDKNLRVQSRSEKNADEEEIAVPKNIFDCNIDTQAKHAGKRCESFEIQIKPVTSKSKNHQGCAQICAQQSPNSNSKNKEQEFIMVLRY